MAPSDVRFRLFVYATLLSDEDDHDCLADATALGSRQTPTGFSLVEFRAQGGLMRGGLGSVHGELYDVDYATLARCDTLRDHPARYHREEIELGDGSQAHAYLLHESQARGLRRIRHGDWKARFRRVR